MNKYRAKKIVKPEGTFDSKAEYARYLWLDKELKGGLITDLQRQVPFVLIPAQRGADGKVIERACIYYADFVYYRDGEYVVEDVKSKITAKKPEYIIKRKLLLKEHGIRLQEVMR